MVIKRIGLISCARIAGAVYAILGFIGGGMFSLIYVAGGLPANPPLPAVAGVLFGAASVIILPLVYGIIGFVFTLISAWIYNVVAEMVGGIEMEVE